MYQYCHPQIADLSKKSATFLLASELTNTATPITTEQHPQPQHIPRHFPSTFFDPGTTSPLLTARYQAVLPSAF